MDTLHSVLRSIRGEAKSRPDHLTLFREFLQQLDKLGRRRDSENIACGNQALVLKISALPSD